MRQQQTFRGFMFIILMLFLLMLALRFPYARQAEAVTAQEFTQVLESGSVTDAVISPNPQTPSGYVTVTLANGQSVRQNVSDVKDAEQLLKDNNIDYSMEEVPQENTFNRCSSCDRYYDEPWGSRRRFKCQNDEFWQKPCKAQP